MRRLGVEQLEVTEGGFREPTERYLASEHPKAVFDEIDEFWRDRSLLSGRADGRPPEIPLRLRQKLSCVLRIQEMRRAPAAYESDASIGRARK